MQNVLVWASAGHARDAQCNRELGESVERGLADADAGRLMPVDELMREFGIEEG